MSVPKLFALFVCSILIQFPLNAQTANSKVFILGENESEYLELNTAYSLSLLEACNKDVDRAFELWLGMMSEIDKYSEKVKYDIRGVKVIFHVFWNQDGSIAKLGYMLRPDSKLLPKEELNAFFGGFIKGYKLPLTSDKKFMHYTGATFPTFSEAYNKK